MTKASSASTGPFPRPRLASWAIGLPLSFLILQCAVLAFVPSISAPAAYLTMVLAPLLTGLAAGWRARREASSARLGWSALALGLAIWSAGAFGNLWQEWVLGNVNEMYRYSMLAFNLATVPIAFLLACEWQPSGQRQLVRLIDACVALALGYAYFLYTCSMITDRAAPQDVGVAYLVWLVDAQNLFVCMGAWVRWYAAEENAERDLFRSLACYSLVFLVLVFVNDHYFAGSPAFGPEYGSAITVAFAVLSWFALSRPTTSPIRRAPASVARIVRATSPIAIAATLLIVSLLLIRVDYAYGAAGIVIAVVGFGVRSTVTHVRQIERGETLQQQRSELQAIAWTDALTGLANRRFLDQALRRPRCSELPVRRPLGLLMIDIDHFKRLNDHHGHLAGDRCLREVAQVLQRNLVRPDDFLARYGGEEFIAVLWGIDLAGAQVVAERLRSAVKDLQFENAGCPLGVVTISVGVACAILDGDAPPDRLLELADRALYAAKCGGRDQVKILVS